MIDFDEEEATFTTENALGSVTLNLSNLNDEDDIYDELIENNFLPPDPDDPDEPDRTKPLLATSLSGKLAEYCYDPRTGKLDIDLWQEIYYDSTRLSPDAVMEYLNNLTSSWSKTDFESSYRGYYESERDFAEELLSETGELGEIPERLQMYFDYEAYAHDLFIDDFIWLDGHVFSRM